MEDIFCFKMAISINLIESEGLNSQNLSAMAWKIQVEISKLSAYFMKPKAIT